jgi:hypothetical protein
MKNIYRDILLLPPQSPKSVSQFCGLYNQELKFTTNLSTFQTRNGEISCSL